MCIFCERNASQLRIISEGELVFSMFDKYPVNPGHCLVIPKKHYVSWFDVPLETKNAVLVEIDKLKIMLDLEYSPIAYNVGFNDGVQAGQTVMHQHTHIIPRYANDCKHPAGGIRHCVMNGYGYYND